MEEIQLLVTGQPRLELEDRVEPNVYLMMEYQAGDSLRTLLGERGPLLPTPYSLLPELPRTCVKRQ